MLQAQDEKCSSNVILALLAGIHTVPLTIP